MLSLFLLLYFCFTLSIPQEKIKHFLHANYIETIYLETIYDSTALTPFNILKRFLFFLIFAVLSHSFAHEKFYEEQTWVLPKTLGTTITRNRELWHAKLKIRLYETQCKKNIGLSTCKINWEPKLVCSESFLMQVMLATFSGKHFPWNIKRTFYKKNCSHYLWCQ